MQQRIKPKDECALRLPAPERANREHHDVALADRRVNDLRAIREILRAVDAAREQHVGRLARDLQNDARTHEVHQLTSTTASASALERTGTAAAASAAGPTAATASTTTLAGSSRARASGPARRTSADW